MNMQDRVEGMEANRTAWQGDKLEALPLWKSLAKVDQAFVVSTDPSSSEPTYSVARPNPRPKEWKMVFGRSFLADVGRLERTYKARVLDAIAHISRVPMEPRGNTVKPLTGNQRGLWRYRIGDWRLVYEPDGGREEVMLHNIRPRGGVYD